jgi:uncharacterized radical SAM protein YgiQ
MFLPATQKEMNGLGWKRPDVVLVCGDAYIDSPFMGVAVIGRVLASAGFAVAIIAQPDILSEKDIGRLGEPLLFWGVSSGCVDSMVANYTATKKPRKKDDLTAGGENVRRPDRAVIVYSNLIRRYFKSTRPIVIGGLEASLRRVSHYDYWSDTIRRSILFDAKADILVYGMAEKAVLELAQKIREGRDVKDVRGICYASKEPPPGYLELPSHEEAARDKDAFVRLFGVFYENCDPGSARGLAQKQDTRFLVQNPPQPHPTPAELDAIYELPFEREVHPLCGEKGPVRAQDTIRFGVTTHRGCFGECNFCAIAVHQGRTVVSRGMESLEREVRALAERKDFTGYISDAGGPTANMYGMGCKKKAGRAACKNRRCIFPEPCKNLSASHLPQLELLERLSKIPKVKKVFIGSGIRHDLVLNDKRHGAAFLSLLLARHVSGQLKTAPEHSEEAVCSCMGKPGKASIVAFKRLFDSLNKNRKNFLTYYFIAAHPGTTQAHMEGLSRFIKKELSLIPEQVQIFTPTPSTWSTLMYYTGKNPFTGKALFVERDQRERERQKKTIQQKARL